MDRLRKQVDNFWLEHEDGKIKRLIFDNTFKDRMFRLSRREHAYNQKPPPPSLRKPGGFGGRVVLLADFNWLDFLLSLLSS